MSSPLPRPRWRFPTAAAAAAALLITTAVGATAEPAAPDDLSDPTTLPAAEPLGTDKTSVPSVPDEKVRTLDAGDGPTTVFVKLTTPTTREVLARAQIDGLSAQGQDEAASAAAAVERDVADVVGVLPAGTEVLYTTTNTVSGVALTADADALRDLAERDDVVSIRPIVPKEPQSHGGSNLLTGTSAAWQAAGGLTGEGQTIAVIDSGIDFTHATFTSDPVPAESYPGSLGAPAEAYLTAAPTWPQGKVVGGTTSPAVCTAPPGRRSPSTPTPTRSTRRLRCAPTSTRPSCAAARTARTSPARRPAGASRPTARRSRVTTAP
ncbi:hypothetical protein [Litorihabitans aurantiacus]|uniref:Subtilase family protein n=1 Tax=Litorihabitans aurantiacus TaxID=1930061 RepID=A0AA37XEK7_9MICO|nr:hypothetical protein [Litorihabitans aurantiacus]GMA31637.1 hypothetical protein GCM10025875_16290 [Litorihabitans aurantiacus]